MGLRTPRPTGATVTPLGFPKLPRLRREASAVRMRRPYLRNGLFDETASATPHSLVDVEIDRYLEVVTSLGHGIMCRITYR